MYISLFDSTDKLFVYNISKGGNGSYDTGCAKGNITWNKGLTKETSDMIKNAAKKLSER